MKNTSEVASSQPEAQSVIADDDLLSLVRGRFKAPPDSFTGVVVGRLVAVIGDHQGPLVLYPGVVGAKAMAARSIVDLHGSHIGKELLLAFEGADPTKPIVVGLLRSDENALCDAPAGHVEMDVDGKRLIVSAKEQLVLRCGSASITLTKAGKVLIEGEYISSRSRGVNRLKGGSVQIN